MQLRDDVNGRRGAFLLLFGLIYLAIGASYTWVEVGAPIIRWMSWMPVPLWVCGLVWMVAGLAAIRFGFCTIPRDRWGFMALAAVGMGWTVAWLIAWATGDAPRGFAGAFVFAALAAAILVVSGMPNPVRRGHK